ncbi:hypothetical protein CBR_g26195 [Chara braunii]|uniref:Uncharacterized protein n=1 Tax=Chara braunii TaxID=69332 RepID=A0A388L762_CHABU|nr:hypothetical protein CBR_g26195 [Chara braunii]|eukprot:GBG78161.1 hypothetical protein CBR_g26195 [Chara braunii]
MEEEGAHTSLGGSGGSNDVALSADREGQAGGGVEAGRNLKQVGHGDEHLVGADVAEQREGAAMPAADPDGRNAPDGTGKTQSLAPNSTAQFSFSRQGDESSAAAPSYPSSHPSLSENAPVKSGDGGLSAANVLSTGIPEDTGEGGGGGGGGGGSRGGGGGGGSWEEVTVADREGTCSPSPASLSYASSSPKPQPSPIASPSSIRHSSATRSFDRLSSQSSVGTGPILPSVAHQLMRLIDSAIQESDPNALDKLRKVVAGREGLEGEGDLIEGITVNADSNYARQVVDVLTMKMGGVPPSMEDTVQLDRGADSTIPQVMLSAGAARVGADLLPWLPYFEGEVVFGHEGQVIVFSPRTRMAYALAAVLQACTRNRAMCSAAGLLRSLLAAARAIFSGREVVEDVGSLGNGKSRKWDPTPLLTAIQALGAHSLSPQDLREWLSTAAELTKTGYSLDVILALERAIGSEEGRGPRSTFEFDGESSGLLGAGESKWPFNNGYAFATWLYVESFADSIQSASAAAAIAEAVSSQFGKASPAAAAAVASAVAGEGSSHMPRLFSFLTSDNQGIEAYFHGQFLVLEVASGKSRKTSFHFQFAFKPRRWYFIGLEHSLKQSGLLSRGEGEVKLYVDGRLTETRTLELPRVSKPLAFCCIGTNPPPAMAGLQRRRRLCPLFAEMGPVYIFKEPINDRMNRLFTRGGNYLPTFGNGSGTPWMASSELMLIITEDK